MHASWTTCRLLFLLHLILSSTGQNLRTKILRRPVDNHSYGSSHNSLASISSTLMCSELCSKDLLCRSFLYVTATKTCLLNSRNSDAPYSASGAAIYGEVLKATSHDEWIHDACPPASCIHDNSLCVAGRCRCDAAYSYYSRTDSCVPDCEMYQGYGDDIVTINYYIDGYNAKDYFSTSLSDCKELCRVETDFVCRHIEWWVSLWKCSLTAETGVTRPDDFFYDVDADWMYFRRDCY